MSSRRVDGNVWTPPVGEGRRRQNVPRPIEVNRLRRQAAYLRGASRTGAIASACGSRCNCRFAIRGDRRRTEAVLVFGRQLGGRRRQLPAETGVLRAGSWPRLGVFARLNNIGASTGDEPEQAGGCCNRSCNRLGSEASHGDRPTTSPTTVLLANCVGWRMDRLLACDLVVRTHATDAGRLSDRLALSGCNSVASACAPAGHEASTGDRPDWPPRSIAAQIFPHEPFDGQCPSQARTAGLSRQLSEKIT